MRRANGGWRRCRCSRSRRRCCCSRYCWLCRKPSVLDLVLLQVQKLAPTLVKLLLKARSFEFKLSLLVLQPGLVFAQQLCRKRVESLLLLLLLQLLLLQQL
jgi:hypothetical protein